MLVLDDARVRLVVRGVVDDGASLVVRGVLGAGFETDRAPVELAEPVVEIFVEGARVHELVGNLSPVALVFGKEIYACVGLDTCKQAVDELVVAADGDTLVLVVEVVVVENEAHREAFDDECRQVPAAAAPLLLGIFLDELFEDVPAHERERLFFEVRGFAAVQGGKRFGFLFLDFRLRLCRGQNTPHLVEGVHVERQVVKFPPVVSDGAIRVAVNFHDGIHKVPHLFVACMEYVGAILMNIDTFDILAIDISTQMCTFVYDQTFLTSPSRTIGECSAKKAGTNYEIIILFRHVNTLSLLDS